MLLGSAVFCCTHQGNLSNPALRDAGLKSTSRLLSLFLGDLGGFSRAWDPQKTAFICTQYTKEMNASPFPQNLCLPTGIRPGLLRFVAEPPGALYTHQVVSFA